MITTRTTHVEMELLKWLLLVAIATAMVLALATALAAAKPQVLTEPPAMLPANVAGWATPIQDHQPPGEFFPEGAPIPDATPEMWANAWQAIKAHRDGNAPEALLNWERVTLPPATACYRDVAMGVALIQRGNFEAAEMRLLAADHAQPDNPIVDYFLGLLRLEQAAACPTPELNELPGAVRFAAFVPRTVPGDPAMYRLAAMMHLKEAIAHQANIDLDMELLPGADGVELGPLVRDLVNALDADNYVGKAHNVLGDLCLRRGMLIDAEQHMDEAVGAGMTVIFGYEDLGLLYELQGRNADAVRAYWKQFKQRGGTYLPDWFGRAAVLPGVVW